MGKAMDTAMTRIMLVDDHALFRKGLRSLLESHEGFSVVAEADDADAAVEAYRRCRPDVVLMDYSLPGESGLEAMRRILEEDGAAKVVMLSAFDFEAQVAECLRAGARGYMSKDSDPGVVFRGIKSVRQGGVALDASYLAALVSDAPADQDGQDGQKVQGTETLTAREREVAALVARGLTNREAAEKLGVSPATVKAHVANILAKLGLHGRTELASWAFANGVADAGRT